MTNAPNWYIQLLERCPPRTHTVPDWDCPETRYIYHRYCVIADLLGITLMPWQRLALAIIAMPRCYELVLVVGRQQGKTTLLQIPVVDTLISRPKHTAIYSAQTGIDANRKIKEEVWPALEQVGLDSSVGVSFNKGTNDFGIHAITGAHIRTISSAKEALRGATRVALGIIDEARVDKDSNRSVVITPTMTVVDNAKMIVASTARPCR